MAKYSILVEDNTIIYAFTKKKLIIELSSYTVMDKMSLYHIFFLVKAFQVRRDHENSHKNLLHINNNSKIKY